MRVTRSRPARRQNFNYFERKKVVCLLVFFWRVAKPKRADVAGRINAATPKPAPLRESQQFDCSIDMSIIIYHHVAEEEVYHQRCPSL